ncbi:MAG: hypothetical protein IKE36_09620 [Solobacterium sp.]|nr:hypothetical protein [Solobacterium sp.]
MNKNYLTYLFKQRKVAYLFFILLYAAISLSPFVSNHHADAGNNLENTAVIAAVGSILFTYILPVVLFSFMHRKRSVDLYFALPINRKEMVITILVFIIGFSWLCYAGTVSIAFLLSHVWNVVRWLKLIGFMLVFVTVMTLFNTALYMIANNIFDGIVMMGAYTCFPFFVFIMISSFFDSIVAGQNGNTEAAQVSAYLSPVWMGAKQFGNVFSDKYSVYLPHLVVLVLFGLVSAYIIKREFVDRSTERAEQVSDEFFSYPLVINIYALILLASMSFGRITLTSLRNNLPWYLILLMIYIVAMFVYRRKIQVKLKDLMIYGIGIVLSLAFSFAAWNTRGFGLADNYRFGTKQYIVYTYSFSADRENLAVPIDSNGKFENEVYVNYTAEFRTADHDQYREVIDLLENKRKSAIDEFYTRIEPQYSGYLGIWNSDKSLREGYEGDSYNYNTVIPFTEEELKLLDKYGHMTLFVPSYDDMNEISLSEFLERRGE